MLKRQLVNLRNETGINYLDKDEVFKVAQTYEDLDRNDCLSKKDRKYIKILSSQYVKLLNNK